MKTSVERINPCLNVHDVSASVKYYVDVLGFDLYVETPNLGIVERDGHQIHLNKSAGDIFAQQVWVGVGDIEVLYEGYKTKGIIFKQEPTNYSWAYQMVVEDLDGNLLTLGSGPLKDEPYQD
jgi:catechol 2,3-dioxygenase-like lactoylglutathione lyase family enzyme